MAKSFGGFRIMRNAMSPIAMTSNKPSALAMSPVADRFGVGSRNVIPGGSAPDDAGAGGARTCGGGANGRDADDIEGIDGTDGTEGGGCGIDGDDTGGACGTTTCAESLPGTELLIGSGGFERVLDRSISATMRARSSSTSFARF